MKTNFLKSAAFCVFTFLALSCSSDDSSSTTQTSTGTTTSTSASIILTAITTEGVKKSNYTLLLFDQPVTVNSALPPIIKEATTNAQGEATLDLATIVTTATPKMYYVEAFIKEGENYVLKSVSHPSFEMIKGRKITSSILVN